MAEILLRGGTYTRDPRLDRVPQFDERSRNFPILAGKVRGEPIAEKRPRSYTWRIDGVLDQGNEGACVGFGWAHELRARPAVVQSADGRLARERVYWNAQRIDQWDGGSYPGANPTYEGTSVLAGAQVVQKQLGAMKEYRWAFDLNDLILAVGYAGPAVIGINWYSDMYDPDAKGFLHASGQIVGGHCICIIGVSLRTECFKLVNSWGTGWGIPMFGLPGGFCYLSFDDMQKLQDEDGEVCVPMGRTTHLLAEAA